MGQARIKAPTEFTAIDNYSPRIRQMMKQTGAFGRSLIRLDRGIGRVFKNLSRGLGRMGITLGAIALFGVLSHGMGVIMDFEQANKNLASILIESTNPQLVALQKNAEFLGATTAKTATEVVGLQEALARLGFNPTEILNMTGGVINASIAMRGELSETASLVGAVVKTFDAFGSINSTDIADKLTMVTQKTGLDFEKLQTALPIVSAAAEGAGIGFEQLLALLGKLADAGFDPSMSATALRNIFIIAKGQGLDYNEILKAIAKSTDKLTVSHKAFGRRPAAAAAFLSKKLGETLDLTKQLQDEFSGRAAATAGKQLDTLRGRITLLNSAYEGYLLSLDNGTGAFSEQLKVMVEVATHVLAIASGTATATDELTEHHKVIRQYAKRVITVLKVLKFLFKAWLVMKGLMLVMNGIWFIQNIRLGINSALISGNSAALAGNTVALTAYRIALNIAIAAQWLMAAAVNGTLWPILAIIAAIGALIYVTYQIVKHWEEWGAAASTLLGPFGMIVSLVMSFVKHWDKVTNSFKNGGFLQGIKAIGTVILDSVLHPLQQVLGLLGNLTGIDFLKNGSNFIQETRTNMIQSIDTSNDNIKTPEQRTSETIERSIQEQRFNLNINDPFGFVDSVTDDNDNPIMLSGTMGA